ncbi:MAG: ABC transporter permease subunit [Peptoniphilus sp.]|nr:ABC transporter permease subunit [Peptoniphilus sp.]MDD7362662.1 ABC transporter permease subunit [Bacillota bacterium]MDY6044939.1 ABC transporter permease subunit [Peptoniphilus sp.]
MTKKVKDFITKCILLFLGIATMAVIAFLFLYVFFKGSGIISVEFITGYPSGTPLGTDGGIFPALIGSLLSGLLSALIGGVIGIGAALYLSFYYDGRWFRKLVYLSVLGLSGIPSIVFGLITYVFLIYILGLPRCILCASIAVSMMMIPFVAIRAKKIFDESRARYMERSLALGISKEYAIAKMILPHTALDILSTVALAMTYGMGATAPVLYTGAVMVSDIPQNLLSPYMSLPYHLYMLVNNGFSVEYAFGTAFVLLAMLLIIHLVIRVLYILRDARR